MNRIRILSAGHSYGQAGSQLAAGVRRPVRRDGEPQGGPAWGNAVGRQPCARPSPGRLGDPLFVRSAQGFSPTARAVELAPSIAEALSVLRRALRPDGFDPGTSTRVFRIAAGAMVAESLLPSVAAEMGSGAPSGRLSVWTLTSELAGWLDNGLIDLAIGGIDNSSKRFLSQPLFEETLIWVARCDHAHAHTAETPEQLQPLSRVAIRATARSTRAESGARGESTGAAPPTPTICSCRILISRRVPPRLPFMTAVPRWRWSSGPISWRWCPSISPGQISNGSTSGRWKSCPPCRPPLSRCCGIVRDPMMRDIAGDSFLSSRPTS